MAFMPVFFATPTYANETTEPVVIVVTTDGGDDSSYQIPLTTTVTFDGVEYDSVFATTNSVITFGRPDGTYWDYPQTPSISLYSMDWVVYPWARQDEHLIIRASDGGFQVDISARPIGMQNAVEPTNINIVAAINIDGTVSISYSLTGPTYDGNTRTGVRLTDGSVVTLEQYGIIEVEQPPVLEPEPSIPTPTPTPEPTAEPTNEPTPTPTPTPTPSLNAPTNVTAQQLPNGDVELNWNAPEPTNTEVERYAVSWTTGDAPGWGVPATTNRIVLSKDLFITTGGLDQNYSFTVRADNDTAQIYSPVSDVVSITVMTPIPVPTIPEGATVISEGTTIEVVAPEGQIIQSIMAWYGDPDNATLGVDVSSILTELASGQTSVTIESSNIYGDPAGGTVKVLIFVVSYAPAPEPTPTPTPTQTPEPTPTPTEIPVIIVPEPTPTPTPEETVEPTPEPTIPPTEEPTPSPSPSEEPTEEPTTPVVRPTPEPEPLPTPEEQPEPELRVEEAVAEIKNLVSVAPESLTEAQMEELTQAAMVVFETAEQGSEAYNQALEALAAVAEADDPQLPTELSSIPLLGDAAGAALEVLNNLGNVGADMAPAVREEAEKTVIASVIATGAAVQATVAAATTAAATTTSSSGSSSGGGGGASGGSSGGRTNRKVN